MRATWFLGVVCVLTTLVNVRWADDAVESSSSEEIARLVKEGNVDAIKAIYRRHKNRNEKYAYICACTSLRELNRQEFRKFGSRLQFRALPAVQKWIKYIEVGMTPAAFWLRQVFKGNASEYFQFSVSMCRTYSICDNQTVDKNNGLRVLHAAATENPDDETIYDFLCRESSDHVITETDMQYVNLLYQANGKNKMPYLIYQRDDSAATFAIPVVPHVKEVEQLNEEEQN